jgi:hypothetical protein
MANALVWAGVVVMGLTLASWAKYAIDRNSTEERTPHLVPPLVLTGVFVVLLAAATVAGSGAS